MPLNFTYTRTQKEAGGDESEEAQQQQSGDKESGKDSNKQHHGKHGKWDRSPPVCA